METDQAYKGNHHYVSDGVVTDRPLLPVSVSKTEIEADDVDVAMIEGLPQPCTVKVDGIDYVVEEGVLEIGSPMPATYTIEIDHWPYLPFKTEVVAHAPVSQ